MSVSVVPFSELCEMDREGVRSDNQAAASLPFLGVENVGPGNGVINLDSGSQTSSPKSTTFRFDRRHVLYAKLRPYLNKVATPDFSGRCSTELVPLLPREGVDRHFVAHLLRRKETIEFVMTSVTGSRMPRTDMKMLMSMPVPLPSLDEQRRIVGILSRTANIERLRPRAQERLRKFVPTLFVRMFGDPMENPEKWRIATVGEVCEVQSGLQVARKRAMHPFASPYLRVANVLRDELVLDEIKCIRLTERELRRVRLQKGDLLIVEGHGDVGEIGRVAIWDGSIVECVHQNHLIRARPDATIVLPSFVCAYLNSFAGRQHLLRKAKTTSGLNTITTSDVKLCPISVPPIELQETFAATVNRAHQLAQRIEAAGVGAATLSELLMLKLLANMG